ncbi:MAG: uroporphyrinogen decarboxylase family protein [Candidatus Marinimicrobia bacterium]|nr:uroporphyrinogen decarboxylase family protein [Candidatus Neomarinimicrobiota bacterium]
MNLSKTVKEKFNKGKRIVAPLLGFPAVKAAGTTIKLAQQNAEEHMKVIRRIQKIWSPDVIFTLMDLSVEAHALGCKTYFPINEAATVTGMDYKSGRDLPGLKDINVLDDDRLRSYVETMRYMNKELPESTVRGAYVTGPYTLAGLIMGAENAAIQTIADPEDFHKLCQMCSEKVLDYTRLLIESGAQMIAILDPSAMMLSPDLFRKFALEYVNPITAFCHEHDVATILHVCGNTEHLLGEMNASGVDALSLDSDVDFTKAAGLINENISLVGNLCPTGNIMSGSPDMVEKDVEALLDSMKDIPNFILSTGCDLPPEVPEENVTAFMETARKSIDDYS